MTCCLNINMGLIIIICRLINRRSWGCAPRWWLKKETMGRPHNLNGQIIECTPNGSPPQHTRAGRTVDVWGRPNLVIINTVAIWCGRPLVINNINKSLKFTHFWEGDFYKLSKYYLGGCRQCRGYRFSNVSRSGGRPHKSHFNFKQTSSCHPIQFSNYTQWTYPHNIQEIETIRSQKSTGNWIWRRFLWSNRDYLKNLYIFEGNWICPTVDISVRRP